MLQPTQMRSYTSLWLKFIFILFLGSFVTQLGCYKEYDRGSSAYGNSLTVVISSIQETDTVAYSVGNEHYMIQPKNPLNKLIVAKVAVANNRSARTTMYVDERAAYLSDDSKNNFLLIDPYEAREDASTGSKFENDYVPFLWGNVELQENYQVEGWMVFESPPEADLVSFYWEQADPIRVALK